MDPTAEDELERQLRHASFFVQASLEQHGRLTGKLDVYLTSLIELLMDKGVIEAEDLATTVDANRREKDSESRARFETDGMLPAWPTIMVRQDDPEEPVAPEIEVDCAARMHVCQAVCCSLPFPLSAAEVEAGDVRWDLGHPYVIRQTAEGWCTHNDRSTGGCDVYGKRPAVCRGYSCAEDDRIWADFDNMVLNHEFLDNRRKPDFKFRPSTGDAVNVTIRPPRRRDAAPAGT
ncbi:MAG TPA: YkgJ family cysteine cluster protein [Acidimicrobiales bacterium]|nr:YkgJ family cysteine cluster protein [Acidimicrobiales bacterium]